MVPENYVVFGPHNYGLDVLLVMKRGEGPKHGIIQIIRNKPTRLWGPHKVEFGLVGDKDPGTDKLCWVIIKE